MKDKYPVAVFCMNARYDFWNDYRIRFLKEQGATVNYLGPEFENLQGKGSKRMHALMHHCFKNERDLRERQERRPSKISRWPGILAGAMGTLLYKIIRLIYYRPKWARKILVQTDARAIFFDHIMPEHYVVGTFLRAAHELSIPTATLPHGVLLYTNDVTKAKSSDHRRRQKFSRYDHIIAPNQLRKSALMKSGVPADKIVVLGSARYCPEWMAQNWKILPKVIKDGMNRTEKLKLVFFPSKPQCNVDLDRLSDTLKMLAEIDGIQVMIKPHTRTASPVDWPENRSLYEASDVLTAELCGWADAVLVVGSSVVTEALMRGKTALYLQYLHANTTLFEELEACWTIRDESELKKAVLSLRKDKNKIPYQEENVSRYLAAVVQGGSEEKDILGRYKDFIVEIACNAIEDDG
ncbi:MAG: hypothetical protein JJV98_14445 [Desulfosarcina sp.]|nr:hypothetical protein [Desulfobacterales bacterium]